MLIQEIDMSEGSGASDTVFDAQDEKDEDFKIDDYHKDIDSDDSYCDIPETNNDDNDVRSILINSLTQSYSNIICILKILKQGNNINASTVFLPIYGLGEHKYC